MRVGLVTDYYPPTLGGVQTVVKAEREGLAAAGHDVTVFTPLAAPSGDEGIVALPVSPVFRPDGYPFTWPPRAAADLIARECERRGIEVLHVHSEMFAALAAYRAGALLGIPVVFTVHGRIDVYGATVLPAPRVTSRVLAGIHARHLPHGGRRIRADLPHTRTAVARRLWRLLLTQADASAHVIVPSHHLAAKLTELGVSAPLSVVPNALDDAVLARIAAMEPAAPAPGGPLRLMWCGRVSPEKRPTAFVEAAAILGDSATAHLYGDGVARRDVAAAAARGSRDQGAHVTLHGAVPHDEVLAAMRRHHAFVSSSVGFDNQPMVMLEAIAAGLPVIHCDPDLAETLPPGGALLAETPDAAGIARAARRLIDEPGLLEDLANATVAYARRLTMRAHVDALVEVYGQVA